MNLKHTGLIGLLGSLSLWFFAVELRSVAQAPASAGQDEKKAAETLQGKSASGLGAKAQADAVVDAKTAEALQVQKRADEFIHLISSAAPGFNRTIKNKPFSAEVVSETVRTLEDGNRIVRRNAIKQYRDRDGRTRREQTLEALGPSVPVASRQLIILHDPVKGVNYIIDPEAKVTRRFSVQASTGMGNAKPQLGSSTGMPSDIRIEELGTRMIEGLECTGSRSTMSIPAGRFGNESPVVAVTETWVSAEIEAVVESSSRDPRFGTTHYQLQHVQRSEPAPDLFIPPAHYKMELGGTR
jgi:hypothetical protein